MNKILVTTGSLLTAVYHFPDEHRDNEVSGVDLSLSLKGSLFFPNLPEKVGFVLGSPDNVFSESFPDLLSLTKKDVSDGVKIVLIPSKGLSEEDLVRGMNAISPITEIPHLCAQSFKPEKKQCYDNIPPKILGGSMKRGQI